MKFFTRAIQAILVIISLVASVLLSIFITNWTSLYYDHSNQLTLGRGFITPSEIPLALTLLFVFSFLSVFIALVPGRYTSRFAYAPIPLRYISAVDLVWYPFAIVAFIFAYLSVVNVTFEHQYYRAADNLISLETEMSTLQAAILSDCSYLAGVSARKENVVANSGEVKLWQFCESMRDIGAYRSARGKTRLSGKWETGVANTCASSGLSALKSGTQLEFKTIEKVDYFRLAALTIKAGVLCRDIGQVEHLKESEGVFRANVKNRSLFNGWIALFICFGASLKVVNAIFRIWAPVRGA